MNTAARIHEIFTKFSNQRGDQQALKAWAVALGVPPDAPHAEDDVTAALQTIRSELLLVDQQLSRLGVPNEARAWLGKARNGASPTRLLQVAKDLYPEVTRGEVLLTLVWVAYTLRDDEEGVADEAELSNILQELQELEEALATAPLTDFGKSFIERQISSIRTAIRLYRVQGAKALREGFGRVVTDVAAENGALKQEMATAGLEGESLFRKTLGAAKKVGEIYDFVTKVKGGIDSANALGQSLSPYLLEFLKPFQ